MIPLPITPPPSEWPGAVNGSSLVWELPCVRAPRTQDSISGREFVFSDCTRCGRCLATRSTASRLDLSIISDPELDLVEAGLGVSTGADRVEVSCMVGEENSPRVDTRHETQDTPDAPAADCGGLKTEDGRQWSEDRKVRLEDLEDGARRLAAVMDARTLRAAGLGWEEIGRRLGMPFPTLFKWVDRVRHLDCPTVADLATRRSPGAAPRHGGTVQDTAVLRGHYLITNRTADAGSAEESARIALRRGDLSPALAQQIRSRDAAGLPLLPDSLRKQVIVSPAIVRSYRNPTDAAMDFISCPGSLKFVRDRVTREERLARAGDLLEMDDATINFPVCVPWDRAGLPGHPCADRHGVIVGRFQWLVCVDVGELYVPGWSYTARPRSSYRGEDVLATLLGVFRQHGVWERARFERGVFESNLVKAALERLRIELITVHSPHTKAFIEGLFNLMWTKLSDMPGQVGRFRGEMEEESALIESCKTGAKDPRKHFPMLADALAAFRRSVSERNSQWVRSQNYGKWIPEQRWQLRRGEGRLRPLDPASDWIFSPCVREWTVSGALVGGSVNYFDGLSIRYDFSADWLMELDGERVRVFFDPFSPQCEATIVLVNSTRTVKGGTVMGRAAQVNKMARYARQMFGYGDEDDIGVAHAKRAAQALRRHVTTILPGGKPGVEITTIRDGEGIAVTIETGNPSLTPISPIPPMRAAARRGIARTATPEEFERQSKRLSRMAAAHAVLAVE